MLWPTGLQLPGQSIAVSSLLLGSKMGARASAKGIGSYKSCIFVWYGCIYGFAEGEEGPNGSISWEHLGKHHGRMWPRRRIRNPSFVLAGIAQWHGPVQGHVGLS